MSLVDLKLARSARVIFNSLHVDRPNLTPDLLAIALSDGRRIDVSWYPEHDPLGAYTITVFKGSWETKEREIEEKSLGAVVKIVQALAAAYENPIRTVSWGGDDHEPPFASFSCGSKELQFEYA